jgi:hypothetical protein
VQACVMTDVTRTHGRLDDYHEGSVRRVFDVSRKSGRRGRYGVSGHVTWVSVELIAGTV